MMVDKAVSTNDNNFNEFSRAYKYDAVISTLIENKILSIKKECKENSTSKRKRRKSSRKISFSRKFFVSCRSKRSSIGSGISNNNDVSITKQEGSLSIPVIDNDCNIDTHKTDIHLYDFDDGTVSATIDNLSKTTVSQVLSKTSSSAIAADVTVESIGGYSGGVVRGNENVQSKILRSISSSHDDTDFNISLQNEQSTSKLLLLKDISTSSSIAFQHHHHPKHHHRNDPSLSSSTSSSVASACGRFDENIHMRVIDKKRIKNGDGDDGSGGIIGDISSNESIDISGAIVDPTTSSSIKETDKELHHVQHTKKSLIPDGLVASIKHSFHSLALYNQYNNKTAADIENNFLYEAKSISAPTSPTMLFSQNIIKSQTMMISSENVKSQVSYIRKSIRCPNYNNSNKITINNTNNNTNINNNSNNINKNNKKTFKNSLSEIFSRQNTSEDSANITISTLLNEDEIVNTTIATTTTAISTVTNTTTATNNISNNLLKNNTFHSSNSNLNNNNKIMDSNSIVIELNDELNSSNQFVENRLDSTDVVSAATATTTTKSQNLNDSSLFIKQNESSNQSKLNSETVIINNKNSDIISAIATTAAATTNTVTDNNELKNVKSKMLSATTTSTATTTATTTTAEMIGKLKKSDELFQNLLVNQNLSNVSSILPSSMTGSNLMSINSSYTSQTTKTQSTATAAATKSFDRNTLLASRIINGRYLHSGSDDEYRRNKRKYKRYHRCSDPVLVYPSTSGLQHCILSMPPNQIHQINCNEDFVYDLTYQADQNINNDDKESIVPEPVKKSRHHKHKKKHRHRQKPKILVHDLDTQCVKVIDPDDLPQRARWTIIATACLLLLMCLMLVGITLRMAPIIDDIVRQENERLMQESINRAMLAKNYTESNF